MAIHDFCLKGARYVNYKGSNWFSLIPELKHWNNGKGIEPDDWIGCIGEIEHAIGFSTIFWPKFVLFNDCIFIEDMNEETFSKWYRHCKNDYKALECTVNHRHVADLFATGKNTTREQLKFIGNILKEMWEAKLIREYPNRKIIVDFIEQNDDDDLLGYILTVYQERNVL